MTVPLRFDQLDQGRQDAIRANIAAMHAKGAPDGDVEKYLTDYEHLAPVGAAPQGDTFRGAGAGRDFGQNEPRSGMIQSALNAVPFATKGMAAIDAGVNKLTGEGPGYEQNLLNRQAGLHAFAEEHPKQHLAATIAGAAGPIIATMGGAAPELAAGNAASKAPMLIRMAQGAKVGGAFGALQGASEAHGSVDDYKEKMLHDAIWGAGFGGATAPVAALAKGTANMLGLPEMLSKGASAVAEHFPEGRIKQALSRTSLTTGTKGKAMDVIGPRVAMDEAAGHVPPSAVPGVPSIALDQGGPNVEKLAQGIVHGPPGEGAGTITRALTERAAGMKPGVTEALNEATGVPAGQGLAMVRRALDTRKQIADQLYGAAKAATEGQPVQSPTLEKVINTQTGRDAYRWAMARKGELVEDIPSGGGIPPGFSSEQWEHMKAIAASRGIEIPEQAVSHAQPLPDPEVLHLMKRYLAAKAKLGVPGVSGKEAADAAGALNQWGKIRNELPPIWRKADDAYAAHSKLLEAMDRGRNVYRTQENPAAPAAKAVRTSLDALQGDLKDASPLEQQFTQQGAGIAAQSRWDKALGSTIKSPGRVFPPEGEAAQQTAIAMKSPEAGDLFGQRINAWDKIAAQKERVLGNSATAGRGAELASRDITPSGLLNAVLHPYKTVTSALNNASKASQVQERQRVDAIIARLLTSDNPQALAVGRKAAEIRARLSGGVARALPAIAGDVAGTRQ